jgi:hypothetical protein
MPAPEVEPNIQLLKDVNIENELQSPRSIFVVAFG